MRKSKDIELFCLDLKLYERNAADVLGLAEYYSKNQDNNFQLSIQILADSLKWNLNNLQWWNLKRNFKVRRVIQVRYLMNNLSVNEIAQLVDDVLILEHREPVNKKKADPQSVKKSQKV